VLLNLLLLSFENSDQKCCPSREPYASSALPLQIDTISQIRAAMICLWDDWQRRVWFELNKTKTKEKLGEAMASVLEDIVREQMLQV